MSVVKFGSKNVSFYNILIDAAGQKRRDKGLIED